MTSNNTSAATRSAELERIAHYHEQAAQYRQWAADETVAEARDGLLDMARQYDRLAGELEAKTGITATRSPTIAEHDMQANRVSGATDAQAASAIDMKVVEEYRRRAAEVDRLAQEAISEDHKQRILDIARSWRELADQREALLTKRYGVSAPPNEKSLPARRWPEMDPAG
jgi:hypothetical protein